MRRKTFLKCIENLKISILSVRSNKLRSILTILIIAVGIMSLVGSMSAIYALKYQIQASFQKAGTNIFNIEHLNFINSKSFSRSVNNVNLNYHQVTQFKSEYKMSSEICILSIINNAAEFKYHSFKTNPDVSFIASDEKFLSVNALKLLHGRNFSKEDMDNTSSVCLISKNIKDKLFGKSSALGLTIDYNGKKITVIGVLSKDSNNFENSVIIPVQFARSFFLSNDSYFTLRIKPKSNFSLESSMSSAELLMRQIRRLKPSDESDFQLISMQSTLNELNKMTKGITISAAIIGFITLLGAAISLMNIMLVSVKERTKEIGTRKAIGASSKLIKLQFLFEAIIIGQIGCVLGILMGLSASYLVIKIMKATFIVPWLWIVISVLVCLFVSITSGYLPAKRASLLDPIDALRAE